MRTTRMCSLMAALLISGSLGFAEPGPARLDLVAESPLIRPNEPFRVGLRVRLEPGWHTYWINPGESGMPPRIDWRLPEMFQADALPFPYPERFEDDGVVGYGYAGTVLFPFSIMPGPDLIDGQTVRLGALTQLLVCKDVCIPAGGDMEVTVHVSDMNAEADPDIAALFRWADARMPADVKGWRWSARRDQDTVILRAESETRPAPGIDSAVFFPLDRGIFSAQPGAWRSVKDGYELTILPAPTPAGNPQRLRGVLVAEPGWNGSGSPRAARIDVRIQQEERRTP